MEIEVYDTLDSSKKPIHFDVLLNSCGNKNDASNMLRFSQKNLVKLMKRLKATNSITKKKLILKLKSSQNQMGTTQSQSIAAQKTNDALYFS